LIKEGLNEEDAIDAELARKKALWDDFAKNNDEKKHLIEDFEKLHLSNVK
jgi:hypothetical protein